MTGGKWFTKFQWIFSIVGTIKNTIPTLIVLLINELGIIWQNVYSNEIKSKWKVSSYRFFSIHYSFSPLGLSYFYIIFPTWSLHYLEEKVPKNMIELLLNKHSPCLLNPFSSFSVLQNLMQNTAGRKLFFLFALLMV